MNPETQQAIVDRKRKIELSGHDLNEAAQEIQARAGFIHAMTTIPGHNSRYSLDC